MSPPKHGRAAAKKASRASQPAEAGIAKPRAAQARPSGPGATPPCVAPPDTTPAEIAPPRTGPSGSGPSGAVKPGVAPAGLAPSRTTGRRLARLAEIWSKLQPIVGGRLLPVAGLGAISVVSGIVEAGLLTLLANVAAVMVLGTHHVKLSTGFISVQARVGTAIEVTLGLAFARLLLQLVLAWLPTRIAADVQAEVRTELFNAFTRASWGVKSSEKEGQFQELMTNQINQAAGAVMNLSLLISSAAMFVALIASAFSLSAVVAALVLGSAVVLFVAFRPLDRLGRAAARDASQAYVDQASGVSEAVRLAEEAEVFGVAEQYRQRITALVQTARSAFFRSNLTPRLVGSLYQSAIYLIIVGGIGGLYLAGSGHLADLGAVVLILVRASSYGQQMQGANHSVVQVTPYLERLYGSIDRYRASATEDSGNPLPAIRTLGFEHVSFSYRAGRRALEDVSFEVPAGTTTGIIGPTGAGKSTISQLLLRLREPTSGRYLVNGDSAGHYSRAAWQRVVAYVPQEPRLYRGTVEDNIRFFRDISAADVRRAARLAYIHDEIEAMPAGYATIVGQQADAVSGGQRQRLCLARALAGHPELLILDEPTSALDLASEAAVEGSLAGLHGTMTIVIIAHRISILGVCDRVMVVERGRVSALGTVAELAQQNAFYQRVAGLAGRGQSATDGEPMALGVGTPTVQN